MSKKSYFPEFDKYGRYVESPCYGCDLFDCSFCPRYTSTYYE